MDDTCNTMFNLYIVWVIRKWRLHHKANIIFSFLAFITLVLFKRRPTILFQASQLWGCRSCNTACHLVAEPVPSISSVWAKGVHAHSSGRGDSCAFSCVRHRKQSYPCASITASGANPAHSSLCMHTQDGFAAHLRAFERGACCEDRQPAEVSETSRFFLRTAFVS